MGRWIKTDKHVYGAIYREHQKDFMVFGSFSNPSPSELSSQPEMLTEWGFKNADHPLIKAVIKWEHSKREETETVNYFIYASTNDDQS